MTNLNDRQRKQLTPQILKKQGNYFCVDCNRTPDQLIRDGISPLLYIDHIDNDNNNNSIENLQFLCVSCNTKKNHPANEPTDKKAPVEFITSRKNKKRARKYVYGIMIEPNNPRPEYHQLIDDLAEFLDCSQQAVKNYLAAMTSKKHGLYEWQEGQDGHTFLHFKDDADLDNAIASNIA